MTPLGIHLLLCLSPFLKSLREKSDFFNFYFFEKCVDKKIKILGFVCKIFYCTNFVENEFVKTKIWHFEKKGWQTVVTWVHKYHKLLSQKNNSLCTPSLIAWCTLPSHEGRAHVHLMCGPCPPCEGAVHRVIRLSVHVARP